VTVRVFVISGTAGSGKTELAQAIAAATGAKYLDLDDLSTPEISREIRYSMLVDAALGLTRLDDRNLVLAAPFTAEIRSGELWSTRFAPLVEAGAKIRLIWLAIGHEELRRRLTNRNLQRDQGKLDDLSTHLASVDLRQPALAHVRVDANWSIAKQVNVSIL
jgi:gluconate kinase